MALRVLHKKKDGRLELREGLSVNTADKLHKDLLDLLAGNDRAFYFEINDFTPDLAIIQLLIAYREAGIKQGKQVTFLVSENSEAWQGLSNTGIIRSLTESTSPQQSHTK